jgi:hypothetical protein
VPDAEIECQPGRGFPIVLYEELRNSGAWLQHAFLQVDAEALHLAKQ